MDREEKKAHSPIIVGHRGGLLDYENTMACFKLAIETNIPCIEFDVYLTKDNVPIIIHGSEEHEIEFENEEACITGDMKVADLTYEQIQSIKLPNGEGIPTFEELLKLCKDKIRLNVELKDPNLALCPVVDEMLKKYEFNPKEVIISSFNHDSCRRMREINPEYEFGFLYEHYDKMDPDYYLTNGGTCIVSYNLLTEELVENCREKDMPVAIYFPSIQKEDSKYYKSLSDFGVRYCISDMPLEAIEYYQKSSTDKDE
ncbi:unnamed protein product [Moneuplotes crassus]|uniref:GP-PDE domain-containing protein n=1 Tax=Euplotes crassus TaxID=5936 RepID=A0AAD1XTX4_EUPCR|nr:unnamed protein product [Moneuplotes crassus]